MQPECWYYAVIPGDSGESLTISLAGQVPPEAAIHVLHSAFLP